MKFTKRKKHWLLIGLVVAASICHCGLEALASGEWKKVLSTGEGDDWYVDQVISYTKHGTVLSSRAYVKCALDVNSTVAAKLKKGLKQSGAKNAELRYFIESVEVDCSKKQVIVFDVGFYDSDDATISSEVFSKPREYKADSDNVYGAITQDLCSNGPSILDSFKALKQKKPFLYLFSKREAP